MSLYHRFHDRFGTAGVILGVIAMILALGGSAIAAKRGLSGPEKHLIKKEAKKWGRKFAKAGPAGPQGAPGAPGTNGTNGKDGTNGNPGNPGKSVVIVNEEPEECPEESGVTYKIEGSSTLNEVCNGEPGEPGAIHPGETLPSGASETGSWSLVLMPYEFEPGVEFAKGLSPISFTIPLASEIAASNAIYVGEGGVSGNQPAEEHCEDPAHAGAASASNPEAMPGFLCVYRGSFGSGLNSVAINKNTELGGGASKTGAVLTEFAGSPGEFGWGSWAVTAP
ncbi:MAG TPA: hypothetical protein VFN82_06805 [Solirubrobacterales bacterium]|nr:hypothetical protein [Solirubrobacterales bacterium]